jgi:TonB family protein
VRRLAAGFVLAACTRPPPGPPLAPLAPDPEEELAPALSSGPRDGIDEAARGPSSLVREWRSSPPKRWSEAFEKNAPLIQSQHLLVEATKTHLYRTFVDWLGWLHARIHPVFAEHFLEALRLEPGDSAVQDTTLVTLVHLRIDARDGRVRALRVAKSSGVERFDVGVLDAIDRAQPFPLPPNVLRSSDGDVYVQWAFHRDPMRGCSLANATPARF